MDFKMIVHIQVTVETQDYGFDETQDDHERESVMSDDVYDHITDILDSEGLDFSVEDFRRL